MQAGDVIVLPAGTAHSSLESSEDYFYIGIYPEVSLLSPLSLFLSFHTSRAAQESNAADCEAGLNGLKNCPRWVNEYGEQRPGDFKAMIKAVEMPVADPVYGREGPLMSLWTRENLARL